MTYRTVFTTILSAPDGDGHVETLEGAIAAARLWDAHLDVMALGVDRMQIGYAYSEVSAVLYQQAFERAQEEAAAQEAAARTRLSREDIRWALDTAVVPAGGVGAVVARQARFADLVVLPRPYGPGRGPEAEAVTEAALFEAAAPVLILPDGFAAGTAPRFDRVVIAWNQSSEALSAIRKALPMLARAGVVNVAVIDPPTHGPERSDPGGQLSAWLARHGIKPEVSVLARTLPRTSDVLARHVRDQGADMLVMGAYGHSRFREAILGGTTRNTLESATVPVFMAH